MSRTGYAITSFSTRSLSISGVRHWYHNLAFAAGEQKFAHSIFRYPTSVKHGNYSSPPVIASRAAAKQSPMRSSEIASRTALAMTAW